MDNPADIFDQTDEDILTSTVSDEALEGAAGIEGVANTIFINPPICWMRTADVSCQWPRGRRNGGPR